MAKAKFSINKQVLASLVLRGAKIQNDHGQYTVEVEKDSENYQKLLEIGAVELQPE